MRPSSIAASLVQELVSADLAKVPKIIDRMSAYRRQALPLLYSADERAAVGSDEKLNLALALLPVDRRRGAYLRDQMLTVSASKFQILQDFLLQFQGRQTEIVEPLWEVAADMKQGGQQRFQAACALGPYAADDIRWNRINAFVADHLVTLGAADFVAWREILRPVRYQLIGPLASIYRDTKQDQQRRSLATEALADYAAFRPDDLFDLLADAEPFQFSLLLNKLTNYKRNAVDLAQVELTKRTENEASEDEKEALAKRQANLAVLLYRFRNFEDVWPLLKHSPDPRLRSYIIHRLGPSGVDPLPIISQLNEEPDVTIRRALVLALGEFTDAQLSQARRELLIEKLLTIYENEPDAGLHGAAEWLLRKWGHANRLEAVIEKLKRNEEQLQAHNTKQRQWYVNTQGQTFAIVDGGDFRMGSPQSDPNHQTVEMPEHPRHVGRRIAICTTPVTKEQFARFQRDRPETHYDLSQWVKTDDSPQCGATWYEAASYCNWLSEQEGIPKSQWCYLPNDDGQFGPGMKAKDDQLMLDGYRLPTEAEWEYACRAGTQTIRYYGSTELLLPKYAWYLANGQNRAWPVASLKPNDLGLFDMLGNVYDWCFDEYLKYPNGDEVVEDSPPTGPVKETSIHILRGGGFYSHPMNLRSAYRYTLHQPGNRDSAIGVRPARTLR